MRRTPEGQAALGKMLKEAWIAVSPGKKEGCRLGWEEMKKMQEVLYEGIDKINPEHENAHWVWDDETAKASFDFSVSIYGSKGKLSRSQWLKMSLAYLRFVKPFAEPVILTQEQIRKWVILSKAANDKRTWANSMSSPEEIVDCDLKIKQVTGIENQADR